MRLIFKNIVKHFEPSKITNPSLWKYSDELDALAALKYFFPNKYLGLGHKDAPDLQDGNKIGIEVAQARGEAYNRTIGEWTKYRKTNDIKYLEKVNMIVEARGGKVYEDGMIFHGSRGVEDDFSDFKLVFNKKIEKLNKYSKSFSEWGLLILMDSPIEGLYKLATNYAIKKQGGYTRKFDKLFILSGDEFYIYDFIAKEENTISISAEEKYCIFMVGTMIVNNIIKDVDDVFEVVEDEQDI